MHLKYSIGKIFILVFVSWPTDTLGFEVGCPEANVLVDFELGPRERTFRFPARTLQVFDANEITQTPISAPERTQVEMSWALFDRISSASRHSGLMDTSKIESVLYVLSGADGSPARLFPNARVIIAIDNHPFIVDAAAAGQRLAFSARGPSEWGFYQDLERYGFIGEFLLGGILGSSATVRLRRIIILTSEESFAKREGTFTATHAIIEYDRGEGTPLQKYIHVQADLPKTAEIRGNWWMREIQETRPQVIMVRAAMRFFNSNPAREVFLAQLPPEGGFVIEGREESRFGTSWEFLRDNFDKVGKQVVIRDEDKLFSYNKEVRVSEILGSD